MDDTKMVWRCLLYLLYLFPAALCGDIATPCLTGSPCQCTSQDGVIYADCSHQNLSSVPQLPDNITVLNLGSNKLVQLHNDSFQGLRALRKLLLDHNSISTVSIQAFRDAGNLRMLDLTFNKLNMTKAVYQPDMFKPLVHLKTLLLAGNADTDQFVPPSWQYPDQCLSHLHSLETLSVDGLTNRTFGAGLRQTNISILTMSGFVSSCNIVALFNDTFSNMTSVTHLNLSMCHIEYIQAGTFKSLRLLTHLDLSYNTKLGFRPLRHVFYGLQFTSIRVLNASKLYSTFGLGTELTKADTEFLKNTRLEEFYINSNRLELIETNALMLIPNTTRVLSVEDNKFTYGLYLQQAGCAKGVEVLNANRQHTTHNPIDGVLEETNQFVNEIHSDQVGLERHLQSLSSTDCPYFKNGSSKIFHVTLPAALKELSVSKSKLTYQLGTLPIPVNRIKKIDISGNLLNQWFGPLINIGHVTELDFSENYCTHVNRRFFSTAERLETLNLQKNFLGFSLPKDKQGQIFQNLGKLKSLNLSLNRVDFLPKAIFLPLTSLETLDLSLNSLKTVDFEVGHMRSLRTVHLQYNQLDTLPQTLTDRLSEIARSTVVSINLLHNPLACTCGNLHFLQWMTSSSVVFRNKSEYTCIDQNGESVDIAGLSAFVMKLEKICPSYTWLILLTTACITISMAIAIGGILFRYRWNLRYLYHMTKKRVLGYDIIPETDPDDNYRYHAFVSYENEQLMFIRNDMIVHLEDEQRLRLCIHQRDFLAGNAVADNITHAIQSSKKTIVVLTHDFLKSYWCKFELNMARMESIYSREGRPIIIVIVMIKDVDLTTLPLELLELIQHNSYLEYPDDPECNAAFWSRVKDAILR